MLLKLSPLMSTAHLVDRAVRPGRAHTLWPAALRPAGPAWRGAAEASRAILPRRARPRRTADSRCCSSSSRWAATFATRARASPVPTSRSAAETSSHGTGWPGALGAPLARRGPARPFRSPRPVSRRTALAGVGAAVAGLAVAQVAARHRRPCCCACPSPCAPATRPSGYSLWAVLVWISGARGCLARQLRAVPRSARLGCASPSHGAHGAVGPNNGHRRSRTRDAVVCAGRRADRRAEPSAPMPSSRSSGSCSWCSSPRGPASCWRAPLGPEFPWAAGLLVLAGVMLLSCGASALNQVQERRRDALMARTAGPAAALGPALVRSGPRSSRSWPCGAARAVLWLGIGPHRGHPRL